MKRRGLRCLPRISYSEVEEPNLDEYVFCEKCADFVYEYCSIHGHLLVIPDNKVPTLTTFPDFVPRAALTIPRVFLHIAPSIIPGAGLGVFSTLTLPCGVRFGPYCGRQTKKIESSYCWQIRDSNNKWSHAIDASDANASNWMRYVNCARNWHEQNLVSYQYQGQIYYRTIKIIPRFTELLVFYGSEFAASLHIDLRTYNSPAGYAQKFGARTHKRNKQVEKSKSSNKLNESLVPEENKAVTNTSITNNIKIKGINNPKEKHNDKDIKPHINKETGYLKNKDLNNNKIHHKKPFKNTLKPAKNEIKITLICERCGLIFRYKNSLECHIKTHESEANNLQSNSITECLEPNKYGEGNKKIHLISDTSQKPRLTKHLSIHTGEKPFSCDHCGKCFTCSHHLTTHLRIHTGEKPFSCDHCGKCFNKKIHLTTHLKIHTGEKPFSCDHCGKCFNQKIHLTTHLRIHTGEKPFSCDQCDKRFNHKICLTAHLRTHTGEKPFSCDHCGKCFTYNHHLTTHLRTHTGEKPFSCDHCGKCFNQKKCLTAHLRTHTGEKPFSCDHCGKCFTFKSNLSSHIRIHTGVKSFTFRR